MINLITLVLLIFALIGMYAVYSSYVSRRQCLADCFKSADIAESFA